DFIIHILLAFWITRSSLCTRQLRRFYEKRAYGMQTELTLFLREDDLSPAQFMQAIQQQSVSPLVVKV
ncbi:hypothetical protein, partial [Ferviditalea candida]|nr:hypothetical protein [Paenibacillaceae bacterium T2]